MARRWTWGAAATAVVMTTAGLAAAPASGAGAVDWSACTDGPTARQQVFDRAAEVSGVPKKVLLAVSYLESRWEDHDGAVSTSGGYGPMHLTLRQVDPDQNADVKGESASGTATRAGTLVQAAKLTGLGVDRLRGDPVANVCGGAAVLASYQPHAKSAPHAGQPGEWSRAVALYAGSADETAALRFTRQVFDVLRTGEARTTDDGDRVVLAATPGARVDVAAVQEAGLLEPGIDEVECPPTLGCEAIPAPYELYGNTPTAYGNYDLADRPNDLAIDTIVIHNTEGTWDRALELVQNPKYLAWHYTLRASDGHVAQHVATRNIGWHAGNWYTNMHSIGLEHEGVAAQGATWFTESMYRSSAELVRYLAQKYDVPLDRAHIVGHDQVPGHAPARVKLMHWDTGPFWDWEHYMTLLGAPLVPEPGDGSVVTVAPGFDDNEQTVTGCEDDGTCEPQGTNFVYLHTAPTMNSPLVKDEGLHTDGSHSTTAVWDIGARAAAGDQLVVSQRVGDWLRVWWLGRVAWLHSPVDDPAVLPADERVVRAAGDEELPVYGRAYPEASAYPAEIPVQDVVPLQYTIKPGQAYVLADDSVPTDYYYAKTFDDSLAGDHTVVRGDDVYYEIWFGHRMAYVRAADVRLGSGAEG
jgi:hypothetical protein